MRFALMLVAVFAVLIAGCSCAQGGCTLENCRAAIQSCRVELDGYTQFCITNFNEPGFDFAGPCVETCKANGSGALIACIASKQAECVDAGPRNTFAVVETCLDKTERPIQRACLDTCRAANETCDVKCSGGRACDMCRRAGMPDCADCPKTTRQACYDCSTPCMIEYVRCRDRCPRE